MKKTFDENAYSKIPQYEKISKLLEPEDLKIVQQAFDIVSDDKREILEILLNETVLVKEKNRHQHFLDMLAFANPNDEQLAIEQDVQDAIQAHKAKQSDNRL